MQNKYKIAVFIFTPLMLLCSFLAEGKRDVKNEDNPNVIIIMADDMGYGDPKCYNPESKIPTPNMDKLCEQGVRFSDAHTAASVCTPSRYALLTGRYAWRSRLKKSVSWSGYDEPLIQKDEVTLADIFKNAGYKTAVVGKWHLGMNFLRKNHIDFVSPKTFHEKGKQGTKDVDFNSPVYNGPNYLGFDYAFVSGAGHNMEPYCYIENDYTYGIPTLWRTGKDTIFPGVSAVGTHDGWMIEGWDPRKVGPDFTKRAVDFIKGSYNENLNKPFFLYFPTTSPHQPCTPPDFVRGKSGAGARGDMVVEFDWTVGQIMKILDELGIADNTIIVVTSDNGAVKNDDNGEDYGHKSCGNLRGFKRNTFEGGHRIPFIMRWPAKMKAGQVNDNLLCLLDFYKTFSTMLDVNLPEKGGEDSFNILPSVLQQEEMRHSLVMQSSTGDFAIRKNDWKLIFKRNKPIALFNLNNDIYEKNNLLAQEPQKVIELTELLENLKWR